MQAVAHFVETFVPEHYEVFLDLSRKTKTFSGRVVITGQAKADKISLHQKDLTIETVEVAGQARPFTVDDDNEECIHQCRGDGEQYTDGVDGL